MVSLKNEILFFFLLILALREHVSGTPNLLVHQRVMESPLAVYSIRPFLYSSLYDRISTRPFLQSIEKKWLAFQLLSALASLHRKGFRHGDIKTENVLVTSWNWAFLADFAPYKPVYLPKDNPADFGFFFDTSSRRVCCLAPERFVGSGSTQQGMLTEKMDVFSMGCVIGEMFLEGSPLFTLSQLYKYCEGEYDPVNANIDKIEDQDVRNLIRHMIQLSPDDRFTAEGYLQEWRHKVFPDYFYSFFHQYVGTIAEQIAPTPKNMMYNSGIDREADDRIQRFFLDFDKIAFFLGFRAEVSTDVNDSIKSFTKAGSIYYNTLFPVRNNLPNYQNLKESIHGRPLSSNDCALLFLSLVTSAIRSCTLPKSRIQACDIILALSDRLSDEDKLDRCLPFLMLMLQDEDPLLRITSIRSVTQLLMDVKTITPVNVNVFNSYIIPKLRHFVTDNDSTVRAVYASCLPYLAETQVRYLDLSQALQSSIGTIDGSSLSSVEVSLAKENAEYSYDIGVQTIISLVEMQVKQILSDSEISVKRALLGNIVSLCILFGRKRTNEVLLSHVITFLNDDNPSLRCAFFECIVGIATYVGRQNLEQYILPLMIGPLSDPEENVIEKALYALAGLAELGLFTKEIMINLLMYITPFLLHPNIWLRENAVGFVVACQKRMTHVDTLSQLMPILQPFMIVKLPIISEVTLYTALHKPLSRNVFTSAINWAARASDTLFWKPLDEELKEEKVDVLVSLKTQSAWYYLSISNRSHVNVSSVPKSQEDYDFMRKLHGLGLAKTEEWKIYAMRYIIWRISRELYGPNARSPPVKDDQLDRGYVSLKDIGITPQTVFMSTKN